MKKYSVKIILTVFFLLLLFNLVSFAQLPPEKIQKIDSLFISWNQPNHPGGSVGVMLDGELVYSKAFGLASLEYLVPNSYATLYNVASVSKEFTAFAICLLQLQGKLSVDDEIRKYLPEIPDFGHKITIRHMLHHTSGLRSLHTLFELAGWRGDDARTNEDLLRFMKRQKDLNFVPGSEYMYCNTGYMLSAEIIEEVTGEEFCSWMKKNVFLPMGMHHTYVERYYDHVVPNNATSYYRTENKGFKRAVEYWGYVGSGNIHTNVPDLLIWLEQLRDPEPQWRAAFDLLKTLDKLNDGSPNDYAFGVRIDKYRGELRIGHGGSIGGFRSQVSTFPEKKLSIVVLTNFSSANPGRKAETIADIILDKSIQKPSKRYKLSNEKFDTLAGRYLLKNDTSKTLDIFRIGRRFFAQEKGEKYFPIQAIAENKFTAAKPAREIILKRKKKKIIIEYTLGKKKFKGERIKIFKPTTEALREVCGTYWSPELETQYTFYMNQDTLMAHHPRHGDFKIRYIREDEFNGEPDFFSFFKLKRNQSGEVIGILVTNSRVRDLWFEKVKSIK